MKFFAIACFCMVFLAVGCTTRRSDSTVQSSMPHRYFEDEMALSLTQDAHSFDLVLSLKNASTHPITNFFNNTLFEGSIWIFQEGAVPLQAFSTNFFYLATHATWSNPLTVIAPGESLTYRVPMDSLVTPFSNRRRSDPGQPVFAYADLEEFKILSDTIRLEKVERIQRWAGLLR